MYIIKNGPAILGIQNGGIAFYYTSKFIGEYNSLCGHGDLVVVFVHVFKFISS